MDKVSKKDDEINKNVKNKDDEIENNNLTLDKTDDEKPVEPSSSNSNSDKIIKDTRDAQLKSMSTDYHPTFRESLSTQVGKVSFTKALPITIHSSVPALLESNPFTSGANDNKLLVTNRIRRIYQLNYSLSTQRTALSEFYNQRVHRPDFNTPEQYQRYLPYFTEGIEECFKTYNYIPYLLPANSKYTCDPLKVNPQSTGIDFGTDTNITLHSAYNSFSNKERDRLTNNTPLYLCDIILKSVLKNSYSAGNHLYVNHSSSLNDSIYEKEFDDYIKESKNLTAFKMDFATLVNDCSETPMIAQAFLVTNPGFTEVSTPKLLNDEEKDPHHNIPYIVKYFTDSRTPIGDYLANQGYRDVISLGEVETVSTGQIPHDKNYVVTCFSDPLTSALNHNYLNYIKSTFVEPIDILNLLNTTTMTPNDIEFQAPVIKYEFYVFEMMKMPSVFTETVFSFPHDGDLVQDARVATLMDSTYIPRMLRKASTKIGNILNHFAPLPFQETMSNAAATYALNASSYTDIVTAIITRYMQTINPTVLGSIVSYNMYAEFLVVDWQPIRDEISTHPVDSIFYIYDFYSLLVMKFTFERFFEFNKHVWASLVSAFYAKYAAKEFDDYVITHGIAEDRTTGNVLFRRPVMKQTSDLLYSDNIVWFFETNYRGYPFITTMNAMLDFSQKLSFYKSIRNCTLRPQKVKYWLPGVVNEVKPGRSDFSRMVLNHITNAKNAFVAYTRVNSITSTFKAVTLAAINLFESIIIDKAIMFGNWFHQVYAFAVEKTNIENLEFFWDQEILTNHALRYGMTLATDKFLPYTYRISTPAYFLSFNAPFGLSMGVTYNSCSKFYGQGTVTLIDTFAPGLVDAMCMPGIVTQDIIEYKNVIQQYKKFFEIIQLVYKSLLPHPQNIIESRSISNVLLTLRRAGHMSRGFFRQMLEYLGYSMNENITIIADQMFIHSSYVNQMPFDIRYCRMSADALTVIDVINYQPPIRNYVVTAYNMLIDALFNEHYGLKRLMRGLSFKPHVVIPSIHTYTYFFQMNDHVLYSITGIDVVHPPAYTDDDVLFRGSIVHFSYIRRDNPADVRTVRSSIGFGNIKKGVVDDIFLNDNIKQSDICFLVAPRLFENASAQVLNILNAFYSYGMVTVSVDYLIMPYFRNAEPSMLSEESVDGITPFRLPETIPVLSSNIMIEQPIYTCVNIKQNMNYQQFKHDIMTHQVPELDHIRIMSRIYPTVSSAVPNGIYLAPNLMVKNDIPTSQYELPHIDDQPFIEAARQSLLSRVFVLGRKLSDKMYVTSRVFTTEHPQ